MHIPSIYFLLSSVPCLCRTPWDSMYHRYDCPSVHVQMIRWSGRDLKDVLCISFGNFLVWSCPVVFVLFSPVSRFVMYSSRHLGIPWVRGSTSTRKLIARHSPCLKSATSIMCFWCIPEWSYNVSCTFSYVRLSPSCLCWERMLKCKEIRVDY